MKDKSTNVSAMELARILGISDRRIQQLVPEVLTREGRGAYDLAKCVQAYIAYLNKSDTKKISAAEASARLDTLRGDKIEIEIATLNKELIRAEEIGSVWGQAIAALRSRFLSIPSSLRTKRPDLDNEIIQIIEDEIRKSLKEASEDGMQQRYNDAAEQSIQPVEASS